MIAGLLIAAAATLVAAPRTPYGGEVEVISWGAPLTLDPAAAGRAADRWVSSHAFEPLYSVSATGTLVPVLAARAPLIQGTTVAIELRDGIVLHDGRTLSASQVAAALARLATSASLAGHVVLPIAGARERLAGDHDAPLGIRANDEARLLELALEVPYPAIGRLLAAAHAAVAVPGPGGVVVGTGPFVPTLQGAGLSLTPHLAHRDGRPFLDAVIVSRVPTVFAARARFKRLEAAVVFGMPTLDDASRRGATQVAHAPESLIVLAVGSANRALVEPALFWGMDDALNRAVLSQRFLRGDRQPAVSLLGDEARRSRQPSTSPPRVRARLLVAPERPPGLRFAERVQLDLHRAGVSVFIEQVRGAELDALRRSGDFELILDAAPLAPMPVGDATDRLHRLAAMAAWWGAATKLTAEHLRDLSTGGDRHRLRRIDAVERTLRRQIGVIPIAVQRAAVWTKGPIAGDTTTSDSGIALQAAYLRAQGG